MLEGIVEAYLKNGERISNIYLPKFIYELYLYGPNPNFYNEDDGKFPYDYQHKWVEVGNITILITNSHMLKVCNA